MVKRLFKSRSLSSILPLVLKSVKKNNSSQLFQIQGNWSKIFDEEISSFCYPSKLYRLKNLKTLELTVDERKIIEISYKYDFLMQEINRFFENKNIELIKFKKK